jgi:peptide chain release factor 2
MSSRRTWLVSRSIFDVAKKKAEIGRLEAEMANPKFWDDSAAARRTVAALKSARALVEPWEATAKRLEETRILHDLAREENDAAALAEAAAEAEKLAHEIDALEQKSLLSSPDDRLGAIVTINAGAGGTESQDWASMLLRMYGRWIERQGFRQEILDASEGDESGVKSATVEIEGDFAYGYLKGESGVHRLVRISPFDSSHRRHTSFASVFVSPRVDESIEVEIKDADLRIDTYRASGAGGQHVNKTSSAVRITHLPTNIVVACQNERSQHRNREKAMEILKSRLYAVALAEERKRMEAIESAKMEIAFGSQIRSYVFHPYTLVKDHRTDAETGNVIAVLDGEIDVFIDAYLRRKLDAK